MPNLTFKKEIHLIENEVTYLKLLCAEKSTKEIAEIMELSPRSIERIRDVAKMKIGVMMTAGLVIYAIKAKIVEV